MPLLSARDRSYLQDLFQKVPNKAKVLVFTDGSESGQNNCQYCGQTVELIQELASLSDRVEYEVVDIRAEPAKAQLYEVDKVPALVLLRQDGTDTRARYFGIPAGYEFGSLIEDLVDISNEKTRLSEATRQKLSQITQPVHIQVFVTPTCPYCPKAVRLAHQFAMESPFVRADMVEALEFPELADRYGVYGVPKTVINEREEVEGAVPEAVMLQHVLAAVGMAASPEDPWGVEEDGEEHHHGHDHEHGHDHDHHH
ncbi:thioredoxin family protein [Carboxydochorda subterranea]|uniref:Thioredoxin family protein n=1 Tax=Carboxydichorda subterranea TaxID=3109565 RepID=A0ABZ1BZJ9_9FIRM|nr:thioredoxin family protein [Limnochorda sp. L945t]WRP18173.1 thioredoxin family protein [Limnochorda sp. L945t]